MAKKLLKTVLVILGIILLAAAALILWLSVTEFKPGGQRPFTVPG